MQRRSAAPTNTRVHSPPPLQQQSGSAHIKVEEKSALRRCPPADLSAPLAAARARAPRTSAATRPPAARTPPTWSSAARRRSRGAASTAWPRCISSWQRFSRALAQHGLEADDGYEAAMGDHSSIFIRSMSTDPGDDSEGGSAYEPDSSAATTESGSSAFSDAREEAAAEMDELQMSVTSSQDARALDELQRQSLGFLAHCPTGTRRSLW